MTDAQASSVPTYAELLARTDGPAWGRAGGSSARTTSDSAR